MRPSVPVLVAVCLTAALLGGCLGGDDEPGTGGNGPGNEGNREDTANYQRSERTDIEGHFDALRMAPTEDEGWHLPNVTLRDWLLLSLPLSDGGQVVAFEYEVSGYHFIEDLDTGADMLAFEVAMPLEQLGLESDGGLPEGVDWAIHALYRASSRDGAPYVTTVDGAFLYNTTVTIERIGPGGLSDTETVPANSNPFFLTVRYPGISDGDKIYFILAARGPGNEFALGLRPLDAPPRALPMSWTDFHRGLEERSPFVPPVVGSAAGFQVASYRETTNLGGRTLTYTQGVNVEDTIPPTLYPLVTTRTSVLSTATDSGGWSFARGFYSSSAEVGWWQLDVDLHGVSMSQDSPFATFEELQDVAQTESGPSFMLYGEGSEPATVRMEFVKSGTIANEGLTLEHFSMGTTMANLIGLSYGT